MFLIDREVAIRIGGPFFDFKPYNYGPFDKAVYNELATLEILGKVEIVRGQFDAFRLTDLGQQEGDAVLGALPKGVKDYIVRASQFVRSHSFATLVSAIYKAYPDMRVNSIFQH